ncbi:hypothetical protein SAMN00017405_1563 [Desulfonispora thiosulfatigenes DSM 11270]|uniref:Uncharacterized protein n=1 Tax=Desulfonispora thiosulfatigenes DSM 11270 TaxID=656914 RepID=A0A1W1VSY8_DESTI|nr:hypothetical protein [Desulfonispora thiosulfatigenes]SMB96495.1 hypothetical protein SAMN00017405_1563 [Desulfonispora thiosulfatigenes DSM 11270]
MNILGLIGLITMGTIVLFQTVILDKALDPILEDKVDFDMRV